MCMSKSGLAHWLVRPFDVNSCQKEIVSELHIGLENTNSCRQRCKALEWIPKDLFRDWNARLHVDQCGDKTELEVDVRAWLCRLAVFKSCRIQM